MKDLRHHHKHLLRKSYREAKKLETEKKRLSKKARKETGKGLRMKAISADDDGAHKTVHNVFHKSLKKTRTRRGKHFRQFAVAGR